MISNDFCKSTEAELALYNPGLRTKSADPVSMRTSTGSFEAPIVKFANQNP